MCSYWKKFIALLFLPRKLWRLDPWKSITTYRAAGARNGVIAGNPRGRARKVGAAFRRAWNATRRRSSPPHYPKRDTAYFHRMKKNTRSPKPTQVEFGERAGPPSKAASLDTRCIPGRPRDRRLPNGPPSLRNVIVTTPWRRNDARRPTNSRLLFGNDPQIITRW